MIRINDLTGPGMHRIPRESGDDPWEEALRDAELAYSPRERG